MSNPRSIGAITQNILKINGLANAVPPAPKETATQEFAHPILTREDFRKTIENYHLHIKKHNVRIWMENAPVRDYNRSVIHNRKLANVPTSQKIEEHTWKELHKGLSPEEYNEEVEKYNTKNGLQLRKKNLRQAVKPVTEKYFVAFLHQYNMQLFNRKKHRAALGVHVHGDLPKLDLYPNKIVEAERNGCKTLSVTPETVRHHRERMEEAGVLQDYQFRGPNRAIKIAFNPEILSITDNGAPKNCTTENQRVTREITNKVPHNNVSSRKNLLEKVKIRDEGVDLPSNKSNIGKSTDFNCTKKTTKTPKGQDGQKNQAGAENSAGTEKNHATTKKNHATAEKKHATAEENYTLSEVLCANIKEKPELVQELSALKHDDHEHIAPKILQQEAYYGAMHPDDFRELAIQDLFKFSASIFSGLENVHPGSWMNALKLWMAVKFLGPTGKTLNKANTFDRWMKAVQVLKEIKKFQKNHPEWEPHYPSLYFDPARTFKENNSFEYALRNFRLDDEKTEPFRKRREEAFQSVRSKTDVKKAQEKTREFLRGRMTLDDLFEYVRYNCSSQVLEHLPALIKKEAANG